MPISFRNLLYISCRCAEKKTKNRKFQNFYHFFQICQNHVQIMSKSIHFGVEPLYYSAYSLSPARFDLLYQKNIEILKILIFQVFFSTSTSNLKQVPERYGHDSGSLQEHKLTQRYTFEALGELVNKIR